jgi:poly-gamma-glutamate synthesis protein (capsule biosynthesis protein)
LKNSDLVVGNLEGPITDNPSISLGTEPGSPNNFTFTFPPETAKLLAKNNIKLVNLGNNHTLNLSREGLLQTKKYLEAAGVSYFGDPDSTEENKVARMDIGGVPISFVNWSDWNSDNTDITAAQIKKESESGREVFVYTHWGEEYVPPLEWVKRLAHSFVDAGADMIVGSHPHIVQESEIYPSNSSGQAGKSIYYSLGNFIFDQYWDSAVSTGLVLEVNMKDKKVNVIEHKVSLLPDGRICLID